MPKKKDNAQKPEKLSRKERRKQKKQLVASQLALEKKLVEEGKIPVRNKYVARGFFWRVLSLCLAFLFGLFAAIGGLLGFTAFMPAKTVLGFYGIDYEGVLQEEYAGKSLLDIAKSIISEPFDCLGSVSKYTPILDRYLDTFDTSLTQLGVHIDKEILKSTPFGELGGYFQDEVLGNIVLGEALGLTPESDGLLLGICYGTEGPAEEDGDYTVGADGTIVMNEGKTALTINDLKEDKSVIFDRITIEDALGVTAESNAAMRFLAYGTEGTQYEIVDGKVEMLVNVFTGEKFAKKTLADLTSDGATPIETARISDLITVEDDTTGILSAIKDWKISDLKQPYRIERLRVDQIMQIDETSSKIARAISGWRLGDMTDPAKMDSLTLKDVLDFGEDPPPILLALQDTKLGEFGNGIDGLRLCDILGEEDFADNNFLKTLRMSSLDSLSSDLKKLSAADVFGEDMYSYLSLKPDSANEGKTYAEIVKAFDHANRESKIPHAMELGETDSVRSYFVHGAGPDRLQGGYVAADGEAWTPVPEKDVYNTLSEEDVKTYYTLEETQLTPAYGWRLADYDAGALVSLPEGDSVSADTGDHAPQENGKGTPYTENIGGEDRPLYYLTTRALPAEGEETQTEKVAYPLCVDGFGVYYTYLKHTESGGANEYSEERVDLERSVVSYTYEADGAPVTLTQNAQGDWSYMPEDGEAEVVVSVYHKDAVTEPETGDVTVPAYDYIKTKRDVLYRYFGEGAEESVQTVYEAKDVTEKFEIVQAEGDPVPADRYLSGVWYFLFGGEDEHGEPVDNSHMAVLDITEVMPGLSGKLSGTELWKLYLHGILVKNPFVSLSDTAFSGGVQVGAEKTVHNLNECTVTECVELVDKILHPGG